MYEKEYLEHHGILGQKWGVRRYQNSDGSLTKLGKARTKSSIKAMNDVNDIVRTMSKKDKTLLNLDGDIYQKHIEDSQALGKRFIKRIDGTPVSFFDLYVDDKRGAAVSIGTRSGDEYRNKGYAKAVAKQGKKWLDQHADEFEQIVWWARKDNIGSIKTAEFIGFELDKSSVIPDDPWIKYQYIKNKRK